MLRGCEPFAPRFAAVERPEYAPFQSRKILPLPIFSSQAGRRAELCLPGLSENSYPEQACFANFAARCAPSNPLGISMLDLDHGKKCNDTCGHDAGDTGAARDCARSCSSIRGEDLVCRCSGEEFVIILPTSNLDGSPMPAPSASGPGARVDGSASRAVGSQWLRSQWEYQRFLGTAPPRNCWTQPMLRFTGPGREGLGGWTPADPPAWKRRPRRGLLSVPPRRTAKNTTRQPRARNSSRPRLIFRLDLRPTHRKATSQEKGRRSE